MVLNDLMAKRYLKLSLDSVCFIKAFSYHLGIRNWDSPILIFNEKSLINIWIYLYSIIAIAIHIAVILLVIIDTIGSSFRRCLFILFFFIHGLIIIIFIFFILFLFLIVIWKLLKYMGWFYRSIWNILTYSFFWFFILVFKFINV